MPSKKGKKASTNLERFRAICRIPSLQDEWYPSSTFADAINKYYQLSGDAVITVKDLDDAIARDILLQSKFSASKKQGNRSGIYQAKKAVKGRREYAYYSAAGKVEDTGNNVTPPKRMRRSCYNSKTDEEEH